MRFGCNKKNACVNSLALVVQKVDNLMDKDNAIVEFLILIRCIPWIVIYSVDSAIQRWNNRGLHDLGLFSQEISVRSKLQKTWCLGKTKRQC